MPENKTQLLERIKKFIPINELPAELQADLMKQAKILGFQKSGLIFKQGDRDNHSYYLLNGEVALYNGNELNRIISSHSGQSRYALAPLQPRQFSAKAKTALQVLQVDRNVLDKMLTLAQQNMADSDQNLSNETDVVDGAGDDDDWMAHILQSSLFSRIPMENIHQLFTLLKPVEYKAGDVVIQQGDSGEDYYIISEGRCEILRKPTPKSNNVKLAELKVGDAFGEEALISNSKRNATVKMITDGTLMCLDKNSFIELIKNPALNSVKFPEAKELFNSGAKWIDVRFPSEFQESSIEGSINIPINLLRLQREKLDEDKTYILYCDTGKRSLTGTFLLAERGFNVFCLDGGLINNPQAIGTSSIAPNPETQEETNTVSSKLIDTSVQLEALNVELGKNDLKMQEKEESTDTLKKKEYEENQKKLVEERKKIETERKKLEVETKKYLKTEELRTKQVEKNAERRIKEDGKNIEEVYNKNAKEMAKLQKLKEQAEEKLRKDQEQLKKQALTAKKQETEAEKLRKEIEEAKQQLTKQIEEKQQEDKDREQKMQKEIKLKIEAERKKLAEQYERNAKELLQIKKEKSAIEAARLAAKREAEKIIQEYRASYDKARAKEEEKLRSERRKLEEEAKNIRETMKQVQLARQQALDEAKALKEKQRVSTHSKQQREKLQKQIQIAEEKAVKAEQKIKMATQEKKPTADLETTSVNQIMIQADIVKRIKQKAEEAQRKASSTNLLDDISKLLGNRE